MINKPLEELSDAGLVKAMADNNVDFVRLFTDESDAEFHSEYGITWYLTGVPYPLFNGVIETYLGNADADRRIRDVMDVFRHRKLPMIWTVTPLSRPQDLGRRLEVLGLKHGDDSRSMAVDIRELPVGIAAKPGVSVQIVRDRTALRSWCDVLSQIFSLPALANEALFDFMELLGFGPDAPVKNYMVLEDGEISAVSSLILGGGVAGIYNVGVLPRARRRGYGRLATVAALLEARELGYPIGVLQSTEMGFGLYSSLGFKTHCIFSRYIWMP
jgi:ribosomal protein S18 acetylase RimI-like enzyme